MAQTGNDQLCLGWLANASLGMSFVTWVLKTEQEFTRQPGTLEGKGRTFWAKDRVMCPTTWPAPKRDTRSTSEELR